MIGIYKIENLINHKFYIGQSINIEERYKQHIYKAFNSNELAYNSAIHQAFRKYGLENFKLEVIEECKIEQLDERERYWIKKLNTLTPNGYNILSGGQQNKISDKRICPICGKVMTLGANMCLDCYLKEKSKHLPTPEELKEKIIEYNGNFTKVGQFYGINANSVKKWCKKYNMPYYTDDYKIKPQKKPSKIAVDQLDPKTGDLIQTFESANAAAHSLGKNRGSHITEACQGKFNIIYGYRWQYHKDF